MPRGKKPTVHQRNVLKKRIKDDYDNYLYLKEEVVTNTDHKRLGREDIKETYYVFIHKDTKETIRVPQNRR